MQNALIEAKSLSVDLDGARVLHDVDFTLGHGEIVTIVGPNGSGKTTLLRALIGAQPPSAGRVTRAPGLEIGYVPQRLLVDRTMPLTVGRFLNLPRRWPADAVAAALAEVGLEGMADRQMAALSGGQFQRAQLARALLGRPAALVLDEPTQGLDQPGEAAFYQLVADVRRTLGCAVLMVGHDLHVVMSAADRVICLNGHICCEGTPTVVSAAPAYQALFGRGSEGALALYRHEHDHAHHDHGHGLGLGQERHAHADVHTDERTD